MANKKGADISLYQGSPDFAKLKGELDFIIIRAGYGRYSSQKDSRFESNYAGCKKYSIPCGAYWFSYATSEAEARLEAKACLEVIKGKQFEYPIYFDVEGKALCGKTTVSAMCKAFCGELEKAGYFAGIYMSRSPAQTMLDSDCLKRYALWLAEYGSKLNWSGSVGMWQYSSNGSVGGIGGNVDMDICYEDYPSIIKKGGFNGYTKPAADEVLDSSGLKKNDRGIAVYAYKCMLIMAYKAGLVSVKVLDDGGFGAGTEQATNELLKRFGCKQNGIAGEKLMRKLREQLESRL